MYTITNHVPSNICRCHFSLLDVNLSRQNNVPSFSYFPPSRKPVCVSYKVRVTLDHFWVKIKLTLEILVCIIDSNFNLKSVQEFHRQSMRAERRGISIRPLYIIIFWDVTPSALGYRCSCLFELSHTSSSYVNVSLYIVMVPCILQAG
jgi:hypothetical protein